MSSLEVHSDICIQSGSMAVGVIIGSHYGASSENVLLQCSMKALFLCKCAWMHRNRNQ